MLIDDFFSERKIIQRIRANDRNVLGELFRKYQKMVYNYIQQHGGNELDAEDVLQESIIVLWQKANSADFQLSSKLSTYIMAIAKNKWLAELRKQRRISHQEIQLNTMENNPGSLEQLISAEKIEIIREAINHIPLLCKKLLLLYYFEEKSMEQIADILGLASADVAKSKKYQCKKSLEEILKLRLPEFGGD